VLAAAVLGALVGGAVPAVAIPTDPEEGCLPKVYGSISAAPTSVVTGQYTTLSWHATAGNCSVRLSVTAVGLRPLGELSGSRSLVPISDAHGNATYELRAVAVEGSKFLASVTVQVTPPPPVYGRTTVRIDWNAQVEEFVRAIATPNTTVLLADDLNLDLSGRSVLPIARGVHILGGRSSTNPGPRLFTTTVPQPLFFIGEYHDADGVRIVGVRIDGGNMGIAGNGVIQDSDPHPVGIIINSSVNVEIAHNEIYGWSGSAVEVADSRHRLGLRTGNLAAVWIHDNFIHHNRRYRTSGYGVVMDGDAYALIERNVFDYNRHALASSGAPETGYRAYSNLLLTGGGENFHLWPVTQYTHQFDVHGTASCGGKDAYCGQAGEYFDYRYNTLFYQNGDVIKVRGEPSIGADVTQNMFAKGEGSSAISQTAGDNLVAWNNTFNALESYKALACDFDGNGELDDFMATGATWWYRSRATGHQFYYLNTSTNMVDELAFGDVNGDGRCDVTVPADGTVFRGGRAAGGGDTATLKAAAKRTDLVWAPPYTGVGTGGQVLLWRMHPLGHYVLEEVPVDLIEESTIGTALGINTNGVMVGTGDFNADGATDLLWRDLFFASVTLLDGSSTSVSSNVVVPGHLVRSAGATSGVSESRGVPPTGQFMGNGDFNADGRSDILWRKDNGQLVLWFAGESFNSALVNYNNDLHIDENGIAHPTEAPVPVDWQVQGVGDFNGDGYSDILWFNPQWRRVAIWYMQHAMHIGEGYPGGELVAAGWQIQGVGDFDADGHDDILWRHTEGNLVMWFRGLYQYGQAAPTWQNRPGWIVGPEWQIRGVGDFNADGRADIVWRHADGTVSIWLMNGGWYIGESPLLPMDPAWQLRGLLPQGAQRLDLQ
jgi:hypothetical protein